MWRLRIGRGTSARPQAGAAATRTKLDESSTPSALAPKQAQVDAARLAQQVREVCRDCGAAVSLDVYTTYIPHHQIVHGVCPGCGMTTDETREIR